MKLSQAFPSLYLKAADIDDEIRVTIDKAYLDNIKGQQKLIVEFKEFDKQFVVNVTNAERIKGELETDETDNWIGKQITLGKELVNFRGKSVDAIRVVKKSKTQPS